LSSQEDKTEMDVVGEIGPETGGYGDEGTCGEGDGSPDDGHTECGSRRSTWEHRWAESVVVSDIWTELKTRKGKIDSA